VTFLGSMGLSVFLEAHRSRQDTALRVVGEHWTVLRTIQLLGLDMFLTVYPSRSAAVVGARPVGSPQPTAESGEPS
jgi:anti-anti-sigma factor